MRVCVYGAGAIGGHIAARLARGGAEVSVIARGAHLRAIQAEGLAVEAADGTLRCRPRATDDPTTLGPQDAVIVTVKAPALPQVAAGIAPLLGPDTPVAFVMNGVPWWYLDRTPRDGRRLPLLDPGDALRDSIGIPRSLGGVVYSAASVVAPGVVRALAPDSRVVLGELDGAMTPRLAALAQAIAAGGMHGDAVPDIRRAVWTKLLGNLTTGPLCLLGRCSMRDALAAPAVRDAALAIAREAMAVAAALGEPIGGDTPEGRIARSATLHHRPSILQDLEAGRPMEVEALFLAPLALAREAGVATPMLDLVVALAVQAAREAGLYGPQAEASA
ncbi:ketopantoate reductase family protein [Paracraurococcus ruber]|uniref:2-dehydropantoate 2-reductase n=1 Tax=Paracraurococcus ruber TaxID=77675 RepID=A0ABS1CWC8_9PROT|nr:2-dehydropantoate 2-reductase [Paracraurococcus ruber]MBK1658720.1 2-dehydropantoate 2-reductase [Paracraurococcus ruber]TDG30064.1 2-dehydropantoate 2-reductase [Paracraurococcus ruber]